MGNWNSGRRPQPSALKVLRGNPGKRPLRADEAKPEAASAEFDAPPAILADDPVAAAEWARVAPLLRRCGIATEAERASLLALCQQWSQYLEAHGKVRALGMIVKGAGDAPIANPYIKLATKSLQACLKLWVELGLTPSSRSRLSSLPAPDAVPKESRWAGLL